MGGTRLALLRGVNVGGKNKLPMRDLAVMFEDAGCQNVRTFIQSGNVLFTASASIYAGLAPAMEARIFERFGYRTPVILRTAAELHDVISASSFSESDLYVMFLATRPTAEQVAMLDPNRSPGDRFLVRGADVYLHLPNGVARTKLTNAWFDSRLKTVSTVRNWRTVTKLLELMA